MHSFYHAQSSSRKFGGDPKVYLPVHTLIDSSKAALADVRHRAIMHSAFGIFIAEEVFGPTITVPRRHGEIEVPTRLVAEQHILEDLGFIPTVGKWLEGLPIQPWMGGKMRHVTTVTMDAFLKKENA